MSQIPLRSTQSKPDENRLLEVRDLSLVYKGNGRSLFKALDEISFDLEQSTFTSVVGESGSGKTSLARCISGLQHPTQGTVTYGGRNLSTLKGGELLEYWRNVQMIFQDPFESLNPHRDVFSIISTPMRRLLGEKRKEVLYEKVKLLLRDVGLEQSFVDRYPHQLSGGQRQRVNVARALAPEPKLLIADEITTMLDATQRRSLLSLILKLKSERNLTVLMITHDLASAMACGGKIIVMYRGKAVEIGDTRSVILAPYHPYVELMLQALPSAPLKGQENKIDFSSLSQSEQGNPEAGCIFRSRCHYATEICDGIQPPLERKNGSRYVACYHALNQQ